MSSVWPVIILLNLEILGRCCSTTSLQDTKLRALVVASFPVVPVGSIAGRIVPITFEGDPFSQSSHKEKSNFLQGMCTISEVGHGKWQTTWKAEILEASFCHT